MTPIDDELMQRKAAQVALRHALAECWARNEALQIEISGLRSGSRTDDRAARSEARAEALALELSDQVARNEALLHSTSWQITAPLRALAVYVPQIALVVRRIQGLRRSPDSRGA